MLDKTGSQCPVVIDSLVKALYENEAESNTMVLTEVRRVLKDETKSEEEREKVSEKIRKLKK